MGNSNLNSPVVDMQQLEQNVDRIRSYYDELAKKTEKAAHEADLMGGAFGWSITQMKNFLVQRH